MFDLLPFLLGISEVWAEALNPKHQTPCLVSPSTGFDQFVVSLSRFVHTCLAVRVVIAETLNPTVPNLQSYNPPPPPPQDKPTKAMPVLKVRGVG